MDPCPSPPSWSYLLLVPQGPAATHRHLGYTFCLSLMDPLPITAILVIPYACPSWTSCPSPPSWSYLLHFPRGLPAQHCHLGHIFCLSLKGPLPSTTILIIPSACPSWTPCPAPTFWSYLLGVPHGPPAQHRHFGHTFCFSLMDPLPITVILVIPSACSSWIPPPQHPHLGHTFCLSLMAPCPSRHLGYTFCLSLMDPLPSTAILAIPFACPSWTPCPAPPSWSWSPPATASWSSPWGPAASQQS
jgi:hypothetical protein